MPRPVRAAEVDGGAPGHAERSPGGDATAPVDRGALRAHRLNGPSWGLGRQGVGQWPTGLRGSPTTTQQCPGLSRHGVQARGDALWQESHWRCPGACRPRGAHGGDAVAVSPQGGGRAGSLYATPPQPPPPPPGVLKDSGAGSAPNKCP